MQFVALATLALMLAGCQMVGATTGTDVTRVACLSFEPITFSSSQDSEETRRQVISHNAAWTALCDDQP